MAEELDDLMAEFVETVSYAGDVRPWRDVPETEESEDEPTVLSFRDKLLRRVVTLQANYPPGAGEATRRAIDEGRQPGERRSWRETAERNAQGQFVNAAGRPLSEATIRSRDNRDDPTHPASIRAAQRAARTQDAVRAVTEEIAPGKDLGRQDLQVKTNGEASELLKLVGFKNAREAARAIASGVAFDTGELQVKVDRGVLTISGSCEKDTLTVAPEPRADAESAGPDEMVTQRGRLKFSVSIHGETAHVGAVTSSGPYRQTGDVLKVLSNLATLGERLGLESVDTTANIDMGGFAWARMGFEASNPDSFANTVSRRIEDLERAKSLPPPPNASDPSVPITRIAWVAPAIEEARAASRDWSTEEFAALRKVLTDNAGNPKLPAIVSELKAGGQKIGRHLLRETNWSAKLNLKDPEAMKRFKRFAQ